MAKTIMNSSVRNAVNGPLGYSTNLSLKPTELQIVKELIEAHWLEHLKSCAPDHVQHFAELGIERYHENAKCIDHSSEWPKGNRILPADAVAEIRKTSLFDQLKKEFGEFAISDEDNYGWEEVYWRLVRPGESSDVGPLHADKWFWDLGLVSPPDVERVKCWIAICCEAGLNGLAVVPGSHQQDWRYHGELRFGAIKPQIDEDEDELDPQLIPLESGRAIVFNDRLLHRGAVNRGRYTRVSLEFTMYVRA